MKQALITACMAALVIAVAVLAQEAKPVGPQLTPKLRMLLVQEMRHVLSAQQVILSALVTGNHAVVAAQAERIHDSFILQQSLTEQDKQDLIAAVPPSFVKLDRSFHELAKKLAEAARNQNAKQEALYFNEMTNSCVECHSRFAADRFPGLVSK